MAQIDLNYPPDFKRYDTFDAPTPSFYEALAMGALPANHETGDWYNLTNVNGQLLLNGCTPASIFSNTCASIAPTTTIDDRRVQLFQNGVKVADLTAAEALYSALPTWELWSAYYTAAGFTTARTGNWMETIIDPGTGEIITTGPAPGGAVSGGFSEYAPYLIGAALLFAIFRR